MEFVHYLEEHGIRVSKSSIGYTLKSRTYRGEIAGGIEGEERHEPIVTEDEWQAAQGVGRATAKNGTVASEGMLSGLIRCSCCDGRLNVARNGARQADGLRAASYQCKGHTAKHGRCEAVASAKASAVDDYVEVAIGVAATDGTLHTTLERTENWNLAQTRTKEAKEALTKLSDHRLLATLSVEELVSMREGAQASLDEARKALADTPRPDDTIELDIDWATDQGRWSIDKKRRLARSLIKDIRLRKGKGLPIAQRVEITWAGHDQPDTNLAKRIAAAYASLPFAEAPGLRPPGRAHAT